MTVTSPFMSIVKAPKQSTQSSFRAVFMSLLNLLSCTLQPTTLWVNTIKLIFCPKENLDKAFRGVRIFFSRINTAGFFIPSRRGPISNPVPTKAAGNWAHSRLLVPHVYRLPTPCSLWPQRYGWGPAYHKAGQEQEQRSNWGSQQKQSIHNICLLLEY